MQCLICFFQRWIVEPDRRKLGFDVVVDSFGVRKGLIGPEPVLALEVSGFLQKPNAVSESVSLGVIQITHLKRTVWLVRLG